MRILHTSDWHIGKKIYDQSRMDEYSQFLDWLLAIIIEKRIDVLLVSGDIFDSSVPPAEATDLYYRFLYDLHKMTNAHAVIIAGNHDSAVRLAAPRNFLKMADIHVIGGINGSIQDCVVNLDICGQISAFAAIPYLNEGDILSHVPLEMDIERAQRYREALKKVYLDCMSVMHEADIRVLMGHYFVQGSVAGDSERLVQIGGIQSVHTEDLPYDVDYIALGHLHRPQQIPGNGCPIVYPGSPLPLSFKEAEYDKKVFLIDLDGKASEMEEIIVPTFRELVRVEGMLDDVKTRANFEDWKDKYIEVRVQLAGPQIGVGDEIRQAFADRDGRVLVVESMLPKNDGETISAARIKTRSPVEIFQEYYNYRYGDSSPEELDEMLVTFNELLEMSSEEVAD
jgi:exonuclease SbcD